MNFIKKKELKITIVLTSICLFNNKILTISTSFFSTAILNGDWLIYKKNSISNNNLYKLHLIFEIKLH